MVKANLKNHRTFLCVVLAVLLAVVLRQIGLRVEDPLDRACSFLRSVIYIVLFAAWGISIRRRIIQPQVRRYLTAVSALMVFWVTVRTIRYSLEGCPWVLRHLWYLYYLPILFIPLLAVFVALSLGKPENYRLPKWTALLNIPAAALLLLVLTNDLHQLVFVFPADAAVWGNDYRHSIGYFLAVGWQILCTLTTLVTMLIKCRIPYSRKVLMLPFVPVILSVIYGSLYVFHVPWVRRIAGDMTVVFCLLITAALESCIQCGLIQSNTHYGELFRASTIAAQIIDAAYNVCLSSNAARSIPAGTMRRTEDGPVMLDGGVRLSGAPIRGGHVLWQEDVSDAVERLEELKDLNESLEDKNIAARDEYETTKKRLSLLESNRLYNRMQLETAEKIDTLYGLLEQIRESGDPEKEKDLLYRMAVIGAYVKRRNNLLFVSEAEKMIPAEELTWSVRESLRCLKIRDVSTDFAVELDAPLSFDDAVRLYDTIETALERSMDTLSDLYLKIERKDGNLALHMALYCESDLSALAGPQLTVAEEDDKTWSLYFRFPEKAGEAK
ncbi:MAG: histidine kinase N-terminal 7TM domain-containing protein [Oscillospiraceae bacterium]